jgi:hypothetical protein
MNSEKRDANGRALREFSVPYTILRPGYYFQIDAMLKGALTCAGVYPIPVGTAGICAVDVFATSREVLQSA